ncbi:MAG TPA: mechanosensitive ion channel family protein [Ktedonobacterales bacterium]|nr:mechanosensitive ion channel family protein [Ktedonobacterales bacterium]
MPSLWAYGVPATLAGIADNTPFSAVQGYITSLTNDPIQLGIRAGLTALVLIIALLVSPWLGRRAGREPVEPEQKAGSAKRTGVVIDRRGRFSPWLTRLTRVSIWLSALIAIGIIWLSGQASAINRRQLVDELINIGVQLGFSLITLAASLVLARVIQKAIVSSLSQSRLNRNLTLLTGRLLYTTVLVIGLIIILAIWGTGIVFPVALVGVLTVALSLSLQDILKNLVAGVYLLIERPFVIGDYITVATYSGEVEDIQLRVTLLRTPDGERVLIPNALIFTSAVVNLSAFQRRRVSLSVTLPNDGAEAIDHAEEQIRTALTGVPVILPEPEPLVALNRAAADKIDLRVIFWTPMKRHEMNGDDAALSEAIEQIRTRLPQAVVATDAAAAPAPV